MTPSAVAEAEIGRSLPAAQAKLMKDFGLPLNAVLRHANAAVIFLNHEKEIMAMGGPSRPGMAPATTTSGGKALKYFASVRVQYRQIRQNKADVPDPMTNEKTSQVVSTDVKVKVMKNKVAPPFREAIVRVRFGHGFDNFWTALQILIANKKIRYDAGRYYFHEIEAQGFAPEWMTRASTQVKGVNRPYIHGESNVFAAGDMDAAWRGGLIVLAQDVVEENVETLAQVAPMREVTPEEEAEAMELDDLLKVEGADSKNRIEI
jgi:RecA/RadA recombinase